MNARNDNLEQQLARDLHQQAEGITGGPFGLEEIKARAHKIRRTRAAVATGAVAAVVAAVVPVALLVGGQDRADGPGPVDEPTASDTANPETPSDTLAYRVGTEVHAKDGTTFTPQVQGEIPYFAPIGDDRWAFGAYGDNGFEVHVLDGAGREMAAYSALEGGLATDRAGDSVAWVGPDRKPRVLQAGHDQPTVVPLDLRDFAGFQLLTVLGGDCEAEGCELLVQTYDDSGASTTYRLDQDGQGGTFLEGVALKVSDVSPDGTLAAAMTSSSDEGSCSAVVEIATSKVRWETCKASTLRFSTDGSLVLGIDPYLDGIGHSLQVVFDADDGHELARHRTLIFDEAWVSSDSWWSVEGSTDSTSILRYTWTGDRLEVEPVTEPLTTDDSEGGSRYRLQAR